MPAQPKCRARGGAANCTDPNCPEKLAFMSALQTPISLTEQLAEIRRARFGPKQPLAPAALAPKVELEPKVYVSGQKVTNPDTTWQHIWLKDDSGKPVVHMKLRVGSVKDYEGTPLYEGIALCDIEVSPEAQGKNAPLAAFRVLKAEYGVNEIWIGETFSQTGYHMVQKLLAHEEATGETTVKYQPHVNPEWVRPDQVDRYTFVDDWSTMSSDFDL